MRFLQVSEAEAVPREEIRVLCESLRAAFAGRVAPDERHGFVIRGET